MRRVFGLLLVTLALAGPTPLAAQEPSVPPRLQQPVALDRPDQTLFNEAVLIFSNEVRREHGRAALRPDAALSRAASDHAANIVSLFRPDLDQVP